MPFQITLPVENENLPKELNEIKENALLMRRIFEETQERNFGYSKKEINEKNEELIFAQLNYVIAQKKYCESLLDMSEQYANESETKEAYDHLIAALKKLENMLTPSQDLTDQETYNYSKQDLSISIEGLRSALNLKKKYNQPFSNFNYVQAIQTVRKEAQVISEEKETVLTTILKAHYNLLEKESNKAWEKYQQAKTAKENFKAATTTLLGQQNILIRQKPLSRLERWALETDETSRKPNLSWLTSLSLSIKKFTVGFFDLFKSKKSFVTGKSKVMDRTETESVIAIIENGISEIYGNKSFTDFNNDIRKLETQFNQIEVQKHCLSMKPVIRQEIAKREADQLKNKAVGNDSQVKVARFNVAFGQQGEEEIPLKLNRKSRK